MKRIAILLVLVTISTLSRAQSSDFGSEWTASLSKELDHGWEWNVAEELRFNQNSTNYRKSETSVGFDYILFKDGLDAYGIKMKLGGNYAFINHYNNDHYYENLNRLNLNFNISKEYGYWKLSLRSRWQTTFRNENRDDYLFNPKMYLREKLELSYKFPIRPWKIFVGEEFFFRLNNPEGNYIDEWRTRIGATRRIDRNNKISLYLKLANEWQVENPQNFNAIGVEYEFK